MADILVTSPYHPFTLPNQFKAVFNGYIYCGTVDAVDPSVSQVQVYLVNESGDKVPVAQPLRTNAGGFLVYNGQPAKFVTDSNHSLLVQDSFHVQVWYAPDMSSVDPDAVVDTVLDILAQPDGAEKIGFNDSTVYDEITRLSNRTIIDAREFGLSTSGINSTSLLLTAIAQCNAEGAALGIGGMLDFGDAEVEVTALSDIFGAGGFKNLRFVINQAGDIVKQINGLKITTQSIGGNHGFVLKRGRFIDFLNLRADGVESVIKGETGPSSVFHGIGLITVINMNALNVGRLVDLRQGAADPLSYNDFKYVNNRGWFTRYGGFYAEQLDGLIYADNLTHSDRNIAAHTNHLYVKDGEWINIAGANTYFEGGKEAILLENVGTVDIGGTNRIAFCGQQVPASGVKINNTGSAKFLNLGVSDGSISVEKSSSHGLEIIAPGGSLNIGRISANVDLRSGNAGAGQTYFGATPLNTIPHKGVSVSGGAAVHGVSQSRGLLIDLAGVSSRILDVNTSNAVRSNITRMDDKSALSTQTISSTVASGVATTIIGPFSYETGVTSSVCAGKITVQAYNASGTAIGVYELLYRRSGASSAEVTEISHLHDANIVADTPAFTWQVSCSGSLQVFPKALTAGGGFVNGIFTFVFSSVGNLTFATR